MSDDELCDLGLQFPDFLAQSDEIDRMIEERADTFNLNGTNIRNILYHVVQLGVHQLTGDQLWDEDPILQLPEPKTRAAKQKHQQNTGQGPSAVVPLLTLPEVRSPDHEDEDDDHDYNPHHDTEGSDESDEEHDTDSIAPKTPKSVAETPTHVSAATESETEHTNTPSLARRTRSVFNLKDKDLIELELNLPLEEEIESDSEQKLTRDSISEAIEEGYDELENATEEDMSQAEEDAPNEDVFNQFLKGIVNPKEEFPEENSTAKDQDYRYRMDCEVLEEEEFRTDKEVTVTKREVSELLREIDKMDPSVKEDINAFRRTSKKPLKLEEEVTIVSGPLFTEDTIAVLQEQLQMHLQLLVQHSILASDVESLEGNRLIACKRIEELEDLYSQCSTEGLINAMEGIEHTNNSVLKCLDIYPALRLVSCEKYCDNVNPEQNIPVKVPREVANIKHIESLPRKKYNLLNYQPFFHKFLHIRPTVSFICKTKIRPNANRYFTEIEDNLVAHGLDAFAHVNDQKIVHKLIHEYYLPTKSPKQIGIRIKNKTSHHTPDNVINHWKETGNIRYNTHYLTHNLMKRLSVSVTPTSTVPIAPAIAVANLDWLRALRDHRRKLQRDCSKKKQRVLCTKSSVIATAKLISVDENHSFEIAFLMKAKEVLKSDTETYFKIFQTLAEYNQMSKFDCEEAIKKIMKILLNYPDLGFEFLSIFSPLPDMPVEQLLETLSHVKTRLLLRNLERHFKSNPHQYKKVIRLILGANTNNPTIARDTLLNMLRGKQELCDQVSDFFDKCAIKPEPHEFEFIDLTDKSAENWADRQQDDFEEVYLLEKTSKTSQKHNELIKSINKYHDDKRQQEKEEIIARKAQEIEEKRRRQLEKRKISAKNIVECGDIVVTWTRDQDREILKGCKTMGPTSKAFKMLAKTFPNKTDKQVKERYNTLMELMKKARKAAGRKALLKQRQLEAGSNNTESGKGKEIKPKPAKKPSDSPTKNPTKRSKFDENKPGPSCES